MDYVLNRLWLTPESTCGEMLVSGQTLFTLELPVKDGLPGSAIPPGRYKIEFQPSPKFMESNDPWVQRYAQAMPHVTGIPNRSLIMVHWLNTPDETDGCIGVGLEHEPDFIGESRAAFEYFYGTIAPYVEAGNCWLNVQGGIPQE
jgi:Family of unknown function (DUF5675)